MLLRSGAQDDHPKLSIQRQCELLDFPRSSYYRKSTIDGQDPSGNLELMSVIDKEYTDHPFYGTRQMRNVLRRKGYKVNRKRVQHLMRKMGLQSVAPKPGTSTPHPGHKTAQQQSYQPPFCHKSQTHITVQAVLRTSIK